VHQLLATLLLCRRWLGAYIDNSIICISCRASEQRHSLSMSTSSAPAPSSSVKKVFANPFSVVTPGSQIETAPLEVGDAVRTPFRSLPVPWRLALLALFSY
jgi:hypothetical protein